MNINCDGGGGSGGGLPLGHLSSPLTTSKESPSIEISNLCFNFFINVTINFMLSN